MDKNKEDMFDPNKGHPTALIINGFWKLSDNFDDTTGIVTGDKFSNFSGTFLGNNRTIFY